MFPCFFSGDMFTDCKCLLVHRIFDNKIAQRRALRTSTLFLNSGVIVLVELVSSSSSFLPYSPTPHNYLFEKKKKQKLA